MAVFPQRVFYVAAELSGCRYEIVNKKSGATENYEFRRQQKPARKGAKGKSGRKARSSAIVSSTRRNFKNFLLTGRPGVGKTSVIEAVAREFGDLTGGFTTGEIRERGIRKGFSVAALDGTSAVLAHEDFAGPVRVGKYGVDVPAFERIALPALRDAISQKRIVLMDEIGKMELASPRFCDLVREALDSPLIVVATVMEKPHRFADEIKRRGDVETLEVTIGNRSTLPGKISEMIRRELESGTRR